MRIGIIGAMNEEIDLVLKNMKVEAEHTIGMRKYYCGSLLNKDIVLVFSRWGKVAAASTVTTLIQRFNVDLILFTGVAGAADKSLNVGDIVIADNLVQHDMDSTALPGFKMFEIPLLGRVMFTVDSSLVNLAVKSASYYIQNEMSSEISSELLKEFGIEIPRIASGVIASGDKFIADSNIIKELSTQIENLQCVEMEGAAVAQVCYEHGVKFLVLRVISDKADEHANIDFNKFIEKAASHFTMGIIKKVLTDMLV